MNLGLRQSLFNKNLCAKSYVQNNLIAMYDGIQNLRANKHSNTTNKWEDLIGNNDLEYPSIVSGWEEDGYVFDASYCFFSTDAKINPSIQSAWTAECVYRIDYPMVNYQGLFGSRMSGNKGIYGLNFWGIYQCGIGNNSVTGDAFDSEDFPTAFALMTKVGDIHCMSLSYLAGEKMRLAIDGNIVAEIQRSDVISSAVGYMLGRAWCESSSSLYNQDSSRVFKGKIFNHRIYSSYISENDIKINYEIDKKRFGL